MVLSERQLAQSDFSQVIPVVAGVMVKVVIVLVVVVVVVAVV